MPSSFHERDEEDVAEASCGAGVPVRDQHDDDGPRIGPRPTEIDTFGIVADGFGHRRAIRSPQLASTRMGRVLGRAEWPRSTAAPNMRQRSQAAFRRRPPDALQLYNPPPFLPNAVAARSDNVPGFILIEKKRTPEHAVWGDSRTGHALGGCNRCLWTASCEPSSPEKYSSALSEKLYPERSSPPSALPHRHRGGPFPNPFAP